MIDNNDYDIRVLRNLIAERLEDMMSTGLEVWEAIDEVEKQYHITKNDMTRYGFDEVVTNARIAERYWQEWENNKNE